MPCRDDMAEDMWRREAAEKAAMVEASLCAVITLLEKDPAGFALMLKQIDWKEAGVSKREFMRWWEDHKEIDAARRVREAKEKAKKKLRDGALAKLTPEEKKILGVK
jgi:hypothetical protein